MHLSIMLMRFYYGVNKNTYFSYKLKVDIMNRLYKRKTKSMMGPAVLQLDSKNFTLA